MNKRFVSLVVLALVLVPAIYAVQINVGTTKQLGGTGEVSVYCPVSGCSIDSVSWVMSTSAPYEVDKVDVTWTPASSTSSYTVYVTLYDDSHAVIASGSATQSGSDASVTTEVDVTDVNPADVYYVEVTIVET